MTENEAWELYKKRRSARLRGRGLRKDADGNWITIKGTHVHLNEEGDIEGKVADKIKATSKQKYQKSSEGNWKKAESKKLELSEVSRPKNSDYELSAFDDFNTFSHNNIDKLMPIYEEGGREAIVEEKYKALMAKTTTGLHELKGMDEIDADINKGTNISDSQYKHWVNQWYAGQDSSYRGLLAENALSSPEVRNAALNLSYYMCKQEGATDLTFEEWLVTPMKLYRGGKNEEHRHSGKDEQDRDFCTSFSFRKDTAEAFAKQYGGSLTTIEIRPIDTIGSPGMYASGECEILVPRWMISETRVDGSRMDADDEGRWITTENNHKVHLNKEGKPDKGNKHVIGVMENGKGSPRSLKDFYPKDSYQDSPEFQKAWGASNRAEKKAKEIDEEIWQLNKELEGETELKDLEFDPDDEDSVPDRMLTDEEWDAIFRGSKKVKSYSEKGEEIKSRIAKLRDERKKFDDEAKENNGQMRFIKQEAAVKQMEDYCIRKEKEPELKDARDSYEGFTTETTGTSYGDDYLKSGKCRIVEMSPKEYLERCAYEIFDNGTMESTLNGAVDEDAKKYADMMKNGTKFDLPWLNYNGGGQEGRHRALAAYMNGLNKMPVLIIGNPPSKEGLRENYKSRVKELDELKEERSRKESGIDDLEIPDEDFLEMFELDSAEPVRVNYDCEKDYRRARARYDEKQDDGEDTGGNHGNTRIPFGLCRREGIKVRPGWTPKDAWKALEGKGYSVSEVYKELKKTGKVSEKRRSAEDIQNDIAENDRKLKAAKRKKTKALDDFNTKVDDWLMHQDDPDMSDDVKEQLRKKMEEAKEKCREVSAEVDRLNQRSKELKDEQELLGAGDEKSKEEKIRSGVTSYVRSEAVVKVIRDGESKIRNQRFESGVCVDKDGNKIFEASDGEADSINLTAYASKMKDTVLTHNHPNGATFSVEDISTAVTCGLAEIRACNKNGAYSLVRQYDLDGKKPGKYMDFALDYQKAKREIKDKIDKIWLASDQTSEDAEKCNGLTYGAWHRWLQLNAEKYGWIYTEE